MNPQLIVRREYQTVNADRDYQATNGSRVRLEIYAPVFKGEHWECPVVISLDGVPKTYAAFGADSLQALQLGLEMARSTLSALHGVLGIKSDFGDGAGLEDE